MSDLWTTDVVGHPSVGLRVCGVEIRGRLHLSSCSMLVVSPIQLLCAIVEL